MQLKRFVKSPQGTAQNDCYAGTFACRAQRLWRIRPLGDRRGREYRQGPLSCQPSEGLVHKALGDKWVDCCAGIDLEGQDREHDGIALGCWRRQRSTADRQLTLSEAPCNELAGRYLVFALPGSTGQAVGSTASQPTASAFATGAQVSAVAAHAGLQKDGHRLAALVVELFVEALDHDRPQRLIRADAVAPGASVDAGQPH